MADRLTILHLFDRYLPHTMNWAFRLIRATPDTNRRIAAPWIVRNEYYVPDFEFLVRPLQRRLHWLPASEWDAEAVQNLLVRSERHLPLYKYWLKKQLRARRPDILHAHFAPAGCHYLDMAQDLGIPLVTSFYGYDYESLPNRSAEWRAQYQRLFRGAAAITCAGPYGREVLLRQGLSAGKVTLLPMSMEPEEFPFVPRAKSPGRLRLVQVATITAKKGFMDTLQAFDLARQRCPGLQLTIAGERYDQVLTRQIDAFIKSKHLQGAVEWLGFIPHRDLPAFYANFDVFIQPSHYAGNRDCEGGPVSVLEAQATGMPVIATTHFDLPSEVLHERTGLLAAERDVAGLARCIERFYTMGQETYREFSRNAREHVVQS